jgi:hypothetical protein
MKLFVYFFILFNRPLIYFNVKLCFFFHLQICLIHYLVCAFSRQPIWPFVTCFGEAHIHWIWLTLWLAKVSHLSRLNAIREQKRFYAHRGLTGVCSTHGGTGIAMRQWASMWSDYCGPIILIHSLHSKTLWVDDGGRATKILVYRSRGILFYRDFCKLHCAPPTAAHQLTPHPLYHE